MRRLLKNGEGRLLYPCQQDMTPAYLRYKYMKLNMIFQ